MSPQSPPPRAIVIIICTLTGCLPILLMFLSFPNPPLTLPLLTPLALYLKHHLSPLSRPIFFIGPYYQWLKPFVAPLFFAGFVRSWRTEEWGGWGGMKWYWGWNALDGGKEAVVDVLGLWEGSGRKRVVWVAVEWVAIFGVGGVEVMGWKVEEWLFKTESKIEAAEKGEKVEGVAIEKGEKFEGVAIENDVALLQEK